MSVCVSVKLEWVGFEGASTAAMASGKWQRQRHLHAMVSSPKRMQIAPCQAVLYQAACTQPLPIQPSRSVFFFFFFLASQ